MFCSELSSRMEQVAPSATEHDVVFQTNGIRLLQWLFNSTRYPTGADGRLPSFTTLLISDAGLHCDRAQLRHAAGVLFGAIEALSVFHIWSWSSHRCKWPVKSIWAAEYLAAGKAIDECKILSLTQSLIYKTDIALVLVLDSKDPFTSLSTQRNAIDNSMRGDVHGIRHNFETKAVSCMAWVSRKEILADLGTKSYSHLTDSLRLTLHDDWLPF